ncbi:MAG: NUDIX domain-containing protein [Elusimicrobia bacterium]|nr:NUDIX domain-containing protein [Elusimicrobiota bacterium]
MVPTRFCASCGTALVARPIGGRQRGQCPACSWVAWEPPVPVVIALAATPDGDILYARYPSWPDGHWGLIGGYIEQGETAEQAAVREVFEESGLKATDPHVVASAQWRGELLVFVTVKIDGHPVSPSGAPEIVELGQADPTRIPAVHPSHDFLAIWVRSRPP